MYFLIIAYLFCDTVTSQIIYTKDKERNEYEGEIIGISPTPVILNYEENEINPSNQKYRGSVTFTQEEYEEDTHNENLSKTIPGHSGVDFPFYTEIPKTSFTCKGKQISGYYADIEANCQVFHICVANNRKISFLCPTGSIFNQKVLVCGWWYDVDCQSSYNSLDPNEILKNEQIVQQEYVQYDNFGLEDQYDLNLASSGGNDKPKAATSDNIEKDSKIDYAKKSDRVKGGLRGRLDYDAKMHNTGSK